MLKVGMLSKWHVHADGYAKNVIGTGKAEITAVWDDDAERGSKWAEDLGCKYYSDLDEFLASDIEAVVCDAPTCEHYELLMKCALAKKHIFTEKALAPTVAECEKLCKVIEDAGITFVISLPQRVSPAVKFAKKMIDEGKFGKISLIRLRNGHDGVSGNWLPEYWFDATKTGGGALMDLGCHPMYTAAYLLGTPKRISSVMTAPFGSKVDEFATATIEYENGAVCVGGTSFVSYRTPGSVEVYGSDATFIQMGSYCRFFSKELAENGAPQGIEPVLPKVEPIPLVQFIDACVNKTGTPEIFGTKAAIELTRLLENAYISNNENRIVEL